MADTFRVVAEGLSRGAAAAAGIGVFFVKTPASVSCRLKELSIGGVAGGTSQPQSQTFTVRVVRGATTGVAATDGGTRVTPQPAAPFGRAAVSTLTVGGTSNAAATEGGKCLLSDTYVGANGPWKWTSNGDPSRSLWCDKSSRLVFLVHPTDTTVFNATAVFEEASRKS